ncbi:MAG: ABC transporter ATP-binding protein [Taibaiella sp.]|nr:ABC transporter ATP-binding protein [Taibaiella sp.]
MTITLDRVSKRFQKHWIFKNISSSFTVEKPCALLGSNGSGKSTLLRIIAGMQSPSAGKITWQFENGTSLPPDQLYKHISFSAPGQEIIDELTLTEFFEFHFSFKRPIEGLSIKEIIALAGLQAAADKSICDYSSGMRQRVKLAQAIFSDTPILLLDEPCTNLDLQGVEQYRGWMERYTNNRLIVVASNDVREYFFCPQQIAIEDYK